MIDDKRDNQDQFGAQFTTDATNELKTTEDYDPSAYPDPDEPIPDEYSNDAEPLTDAELLDAVADEYEAGESLRSISLTYDLPVAKTRKLLITAGLYHTEKSDKVAELWRQKEAKYSGARDLNEKQIKKIIMAETCKELHMKEQTVYSYLPYSSATYRRGMESDANIRKKRQVARMRAAREVSYYQTHLPQMLPKEMRLSDEDQLAGSLDEMSADESARFEQYADAMWQAIVKFEGYTFQLVSGDSFTYKVITPKQIKINTKKKPITKASVDLALLRMLEAENLGIEIKGPKQLGVFGASYIYSIVNRIIDYYKEEEPVSAKKGTICERCRGKYATVCIGNGSYCEECAPIMEGYFKSYKEAVAAMEQDGETHTSAMNSTPHSPRLTYIVNDGSYSTTMEIGYVVTVAGCWWEAKEVSQISTEYVKSAVERAKQAEEDKVQFLKSLLTSKSKNVEEQQHKAEMFRMFTQPGAYQTAYHDRGNDCEREGYSFRIYSDNQANKAAELVDFKKKIMDGIKKKGLSYGEISWIGIGENALCLNGKEATISDTGEGEVVYSEEHGAELVIDGWRLNPDQFFNLLSSREGFRFKFEFVEDGERFSRDVEESE